MFILFFPLIIVAHTVELLSLIDAYPEAFVEPSEAPVVQPSSSVTQSSESSGLMSLISEFPEAFAEPEERSQSSEPISESEPAQADTSVTDNAPEKAVNDTGALVFDLPSGYEMALHQTISSFGWGKIEAFLRYEEQALQSIWIVVGKSGTEVQSFCEAIARLTNKLLAMGTPIPEIVRELRGIRGGDSEGLGPHRFLGLVDLFGKILQDAPATMTMNASAPVSVPDRVTQEIPVQQASPAESFVEEASASSGHQWVALSDSSAIASLCPECGAELQQVNGCSGGACVVCGYSSCS